MFERENRREKIIEAKLREQRLKMRAKTEINNQKPSVSAMNTLLEPNQSVLDTLTKEFLEQVSDEGFGAWRNRVQNSARTKM